MELVQPEGIPRPYTVQDVLQIPAVQHPAFRTTLAVQNGVEKNLLIRTWGGLGDQICAEPTLRFALDQFKNCKISLASEQPELFRHLKFHDVINLKKFRPIYENYLTLETITPPDQSNLVWLFFSHMTTNCVDFPSLCALRSQLPISYKQVQLEPLQPDTVFTAENPQGYVWIHAGRHWPSKTFPYPWWNQVLEHLIKNKLIPVLIGADTDDNRGTVNVIPDGCLDLRNRLTVSETIWHLKNVARVLLTNDSAPLHMAAPGNAWIGYIATCKHPDYITHYRRGGWSWRMENLGVGGMWDIVNQCPNQEAGVTVDQVDPEVLKSWLPAPEAYAQWAIDKLHSPV